MLAGDEQTSDDSRVADKGKKFCPYCAEEIQEAAIVCRYCGRTVSEQTGGRSKKFIYALLAGFLVLAIITALVIISLYYIKGLRRIYEQQISRLSGNNLQLFDANAALGSELRKMKDELSNSNANLLETNNVVNDTRLELDLSNQQVISVTSSLESAVATQTALQLSYDKLKTKNNEDTARLQTLSSMLCNEGTTPIVSNFGSNAEVSVDLKKWFIDHSSGIQFRSATWELIWTNQQTAMHNIYWSFPNNNKRFVQKYIVFFDDSYFRPKSIFSINHQCWIDR